MADNTTVKKVGFVKGLVYEFKKITWPKKEAFKKTSTIVAIFCLMYIFYVGVLDYLFSRLITLILSAK